MEHAPSRSVRPRASQGEPGVLPAAPGGGLRRGARNGQETHVAAVLALAVLALGVTAAPALAAYPNTLGPGIAAVHPWWGAEPVIWEECDAAGNWCVWSASEPALEWAPYKAIPADYDVWFVGWIFSSPRGQIARSVGTTSIDCMLYDPDGTLRWSIKPKAAKTHWGPVGSAGRLSSSTGRSARCG